MKVGVKLWSRDNEDLERYSFADFIEVMAVPQTSLEHFKSYNYEYTIHAPHSQLGVNIADSKREKKNTELIKWAVKAADELNAKIIVVHAGYTTNRLNIKNPLENMKKILARIYDERVHIENIFAVEEEKVGKGATPEQIRQIIAPKLGFCLDFGHALISAEELGKNHKGFVKEFLKLKPNYFHLAGTNAKAGEDHLSLFKGSFDLKWIKEIIKKHDKPVCLETPMDIEQRRKEVKLMKS